MKFITEDDLRDLYKKEPFTTYEIEPGARLTPGARQFLTDRGINKFDEDFCIKKSTENLKPQAEKPEEKNTWKKKKLHCKMKSTEALFLITAEQLLNSDVFLAQRVIHLTKQFYGLTNALEGKGQVENLYCQECTGFKSENFCADLDDCFEITEFHLQLEKSKEILSLHRLRCALREVEPVILEVNDGEDENKLYNELIEKLNQIINTLSQMICSAVGGKECQRIR